MRNAPNQFGSESRSANQADNPPFVVQSEITDAPPLSVSNSANALAPALSAVKRMGKSIPTVLVMVALFGVWYLGHHLEWKVPRFSQLTGSSTTEELDWCEEHGVPEADCIACNADLMPKGQLFGWCERHGVHECVLEHPELAELNSVPRLTAQELVRLDQALLLRPRPENNAQCQMHLRRIQFPSDAAVNKAGIDIRFVERGPISESIGVTGEVVYDPTRVARLSSRASGTVWRVEKNVGDFVKQGEVLAIVDAAEVGKTKADLLQASVQLQLRSNTARQLAQLQSGAVAVRSVREAEAAAAEAVVSVRKSIQSLTNLGLPISFAEVRDTPPEELRERIQMLGLPRNITQHLEPGKTSSNLIPVLSPRDGTIVTREVVEGEAVDNSRALFVVADTSQMWVLLNVSLEDAEHVQLGQELKFEPDGTNRMHIGKLTWISTDVDRTTRTIEVRGQLDNADRQLRNETFGVGSIVLREENNATLVPRSAVHWEGCCHVVFVRDRNFMKKGAFKVFHTRSVRPGVTQGDTTEIIAGLYPDEIVVTSGSGVLRAELLKGELGAG